MPPGIEWRNVQVSNPTPRPMERVTVTGELWLVGPWPLPDRPAKDNEVTLTWDAALAGKTRTDEGGRFSIPFDAPLVPSLYTYVLSRTEPYWPGLPNYYVSIEVLPEGVPEFPCPWCGAPFYTPEELEAHKAICPQRPTVPPVPWGKILLYSSIGLIGLGMVLTVMKRG